MRTLLASSSLCWLAACAAPALDVQARYGRFDIQGTAGGSNSGVSGSADLEQAGLEEDDAIAGRVDLKFGVPHLIAFVQAPSYRGSGALDVEVSDGTNTIPVGASIDSQLDLRQYALGFVFDLIPGDTFELALGLGAAYVDVGFQFEETSLGTTVASSEQLPVPLLAAAASVWIGALQVSLFVGGLDYTHDDDSLRYVDADLYARWKLFGSGTLLRTSLLAGYRWTELDLEYDDDSTAIDTDISLRGLYLGLEVSL